MYNFFADKSDLKNNTFYLNKDQRNHIINVLRMKSGDRIYISCDRKTYLCAIVNAESDTVAAEIIDPSPVNNELSADIYLFQGLPKGDKIELIIQKATELGAAGVYPVEMKRSVAKYDDKRKVKKVSRWQLIAQSAAEQSKRSAVPEVYDILPLRVSVKIAENFDLIIVPYENENGMAEYAEVLSSVKPGMKIAVFIGPEGGFDDEEINTLKTVGAKFISLGKRILRTETAAITALSALMLHLESSEVK